MKNVRKLTTLAVLAAILFVVQIALSFLPNIELVSLLIIIYAHSLKKWDAFIVIAVFTLLETTVWGVHDWVLGYLWIWPVLVFLSILFHPILKERSEFWALFAMGWALLFGFLFGVHNAVLYGVKAGIAYYLRGISTDIIHAAGNYILTLLLYKPVKERFTKLYEKQEKLWK